jgi:hypothetical protein
MRKPCFAMRNRAFLFVGCVNVCAIPGLWLEDDYHKASGRNAY